MYLRIICLSLIIFPLQISPVLVKAEKLKDNNNNKCFYFYYDFHEFPAHREKLQLDKLVNILEEQEKQSQYPLDIIVEQPLDFVKQFDPYPRTMRELKTKIEEKNLSNTCVIPAEIRCASIAAMFLLNQDNFYYLDPELTIALKNAKYRIKDITFKNVTNEFYTYKKKLTPTLKKMQQMKPLLNDVVTLDRYEKNFKKILRNYKIDSSQSILDFAQSEKMDKRKRISLKIQDLFGHLFDLHLFKSIYKRLNENKEIMLISGYMHSLKVSQMLRQMNFEHSKSHDTGFNPYEPHEFTPLSRDQLDLFTPDPGWCNVF